MTDNHKTIEAVEVRVCTAHRQDCPLHRDIGIAEELAEDALVTALELYPEEGIPENPAAW
jgi:predicted RNA polymerase sigma factor